MSRKNGGSLDANVLLRLLVADIEDQKNAALELIHSGQDFFVADTAIIETVYALHTYYGVPRSEIVASMQPFKNHHRIHYNRDIFTETLELYRKRPALSIEDCYLAVAAKQTHNVPLWTFDKKLARQSGNIAKEMPAAVNLV